MNLLKFLDPYRWLLAAGLIAALAIGIPILWHRHNEHQQEIGYKRRAEEDRKASEAQTARNRELQRAAELRYTVQTEARDRFITKTVTEVRYAAQPLAACPVPEPLRVRLNQAGACADSAAACGLGDEVRQAR